jgi:hypothetical protein
MSKMSSHCSFEHLKHKLWPKEGPGVKLTIWLPITKSQESTWFTCLQRACIIPLKSSRQELQLCFRSHLHWRFDCKVMGLQSHGSPNLGDFGMRLPLGSLGTKSHLNVGFVASHRVYYKGEGCGFPQVRVVVNLVCPCCPRLVLAPKVLQLCINHLVWVLCRLVWVSEACQFFLVPSRSFNTPFYPSKCYEPRSMPRFLLLSLFYTWIHIWVPQGVGSASMYVILFFIFSMYLL